MPRTSVYEITINCPHCQLPILIHSNEINCAIFRHGTFKNTGKQIDPHTPKLKCDEYAEKGLIYGCGKPFKLAIVENNIAAIACDYI